MRSKEGKDSGVKHFDTIAAIATGAGNAGIGIVRISGPEALDIAGRTFVPSGKLSGYEPQRLHYGRVIDSNGSTIDSGFLAYMKRPASYTGEDVVELQCHGGALGISRVLEAVLKAGARCAEAGEFTKRAFLNGKLDLAEAEAVSELIGATTDASLKSASARVGGALSKKITDLKDGLVDILSRLEAELDFAEDEPEDEVGEVSTDEIISVLEATQLEIEGLIYSYEEGRARTEGVKVLILGRPNVGKSSLLNVLIKEDRAIVTEHPGTTRDLIEEGLVVKGLPLKVIDSAGLRAGCSEVEAIGVERARAKVAEAELILFVVDASATAEDLCEDASLLGSALECEGESKVVVVANKMDLYEDNSSSQELRGKLSGALSEASLVEISATEGRGIDKLGEAIYREVTGHSHSTAASERAPGELVTSLRQKRSLEGTLEGLSRVRRLLEEKAEKEIIAGEMRITIDRLGEITGETTTEDILDAIFSKFCIGK